MARTSVVYNYSERGMNTNVFMNVNLLRVVRKADTDDTSNYTSTSKKSVLSTDNPEPAWTTWCTHTTWTR